MEIRKGKFGIFGGQFAPEILMPALNELGAAFEAAISDRDFVDKLNYYLADFAGRPTPLYLLESFSKEYGSKIYIKREDLLHGGAHKLNNTLGQGLLAKRMGKTRLIAETGAGQHGVSVALTGAMLSLPVEIYMGKKDIERQKLNVFRMELMGAKVIPVLGGSQTLKDAVNDAFRDWVTNVYDTYYVFGTAAGPHPYPQIVKKFQSVIGAETKKQVLEKEGKLPDDIIACVGGGSNAIGMFSHFIDEPSVALHAVEAGGKGVNTDYHGASIAKGDDGVFHGMRTRVLQDSYGQIKESYSISAGLDYPGVGPELADLASKGRLKVHSATDDEALNAFRQMSDLEGIIPALEPAHAIAYMMRASGELKDHLVVINLSGRGDKDVHTVAGKMGFRL